MNMSKKIFVLDLVLLTIFGLGFTAPVVYAEEDVEEDTPFSIEENITLKNGCEVEDTAGETHIFPQENSPSEYLAICAMTEILEQGLINDIDFVDFGFGLFIDNFNDLIKPENSYWKFYLNENSSNVGVAQAPVEKGDIISFVLTTFDPITFAETAVEPSQSINARIIELLESSEESEEETQGGGSGSGGETLSTKNFNSQNALAYLKSAQAADGSFGGADLYTDWAGIAFGALNVTDSSRDLLLSYLNSHNSISSLLTDNERHAMALLALGQNPYSFNGVNYINAIVNSFDNIQFGDANLVNDDIFALIPLGNSGYTKNDDIIAKDIAFIISKQKTNGSWEESVDITAAAIQALKSFESIASVAESLSKATNYIISKQNNDGGFGDSASSVYSTSWAMQAMGALGESWTKDGYTASFYLGGQQAEDGAALPSSETLSNRIWATSYAIAGNSLKPWSEIMESFPKPATQNNSNNSSNTSTSTNTSTVYKTSTNSPQTNPETKKVLTSVAVNTPVITPVIDKKITPIPETKKSTTVPKNLPADTEEIVPGALTAAAVNALPIEETPKNTIPIALGVGTGIVLLYIAFKFFVA